MPIKGARHVYHAGVHANGCIWSEFCISGERKFRRIFSENNMFGETQSMDRWILLGYGSAVVLGGTWEEEVVEARVGGGKPVGQGNPLETR